MTEDSVGMRYEDPGSVLLVSTGVVSRQLLAYQP